MSEERIVVGYKDDPKKMKVVHTTSKKVDSVVKKNGFTSHFVTEANEWYGYLVIQAWGEAGIDVYEFESYTPATLNMDMRDDDHFLYDIEERKFVDFDLPSWDRRSRAKTDKDAMKYIASRLSELFYDISDKDAEELTDYADNWSVPLNLDMHRTFQRVFKTEHPNWDSSDGRCPW
jgi:hypothetical protein